jgi:hypothetical protein
VDPFGHIEIALRADCEAGWSMEVAVDYRARLELAARCPLRDVIGKNAARAGGADEEGFAVTASAVRP